jgi:hypothetical protein
MYALNGGVMERRREAQGSSLSFPTGFPEGGSAVVKLVLVLLASALLAGVVNEILADVRHRARRLRPQHQQHWRMDR